MIDLKTLDALVASLSDLADEARDIGRGDTAVLAEDLAARGRLLRTSPKRFNITQRLAYQSEMRAFFDDVRLSLQASASQAAADNNLATDDFISAA